MNNLIRSYFYRIRKMKIYFWSLPISFLLVPLVAYGGGYLSKDMTMSELIPAIAPIILLFLIYAPVCVLPSLCGADYMDKTVCLDIMAGHSRVGIYLSKLWVSFVAAIPYPFLCVLLPIGICSLFYEYGNSCDAKGLWIRFGLMLLTEFRILTEMLVMIIIVRNAFAGSVFVMGVYMVGLFGGMGVHLVYPNYSVINGIFFGRALLELGDFNSRMGFANGRDVIFYDASLSEAFVTSLIISNLVLTILFFLAGLIHTIKSDY